MNSHIETRKFLWLDLENGWIAFDIKINGIHSRYEYLEIERYENGPREVTTLNEKRKHEFK